MNAAFRLKHQEWDRCLNAKDPNAIFQQIPRLIWNAAAYRIVNECRRHAPEEGSAQLSGLLHRLLDSSFFESQLVAVRRLTDAGGLSGARGTFSLRSLVDDMRRHRQLLTRENLLAVDGYAMDTQATAAAAEEFLAGEFAAGKRETWLPRQLDVGMADRRHKEIDELCGVGAAARSSSDTVPDRLFELMASRLTEVQADVQVYVNKFIAHAATPESRGRSSADQITITLGHLWRAHEAICRVANLLDCTFVSRASHGFLPIPQYDQFAYITTPLANPATVPHLRDVWSEYAKETVGWASGTKEWLEAVTSGTS